MKMMDIERFNGVIENAYCLGVKAGIKQMEIKIQKHCKLGKPVLCNGELYFFQDSKRHLIDIMDDIDAEYGVEKDKKYIVPISLHCKNGKVEREVIIKTNRPETAMLIAIGDFEHNGWVVDKNFENYKQLE